MLPLTGILPLMKQTPRDYTSGSVAGQEAILKGLLERKLVVQHPVIFAFPNVSGEFTSRNYQYNGQAQFSLDHKDHFNVETFKLEMVPNSNLLTGELNGHFEPNEQVNGRDYSLHLTVKGTVNVDGYVDLTLGGGEYLMTSSRSGRYIYREDGATAYLGRPNRGGNPAVGKATRQKVNVTFYDYAFSPEMEKQILRIRQGPYVPGGSFEVGETSGLHLLIETEAAAQFSWQVSLNDIGRILVGTGQPRGKGEVAFGKKPDGAWFVDRVTFDGYAPPAQ
jgi:hypothetical protein